MKRTLISLVIAIVAGFPVSWIAAMLLTPVLWRLEPVLHMELAGHSGPSDWVFLLMWVLVAIAFFGILCLATPNTMPRASPPK